MDLSQVSESISTTNELVANAVNAQTEVNDKLMNQSVESQTKGSQGTNLQEPGKGLLIDTLA